MALNGDYDPKDEDTLFESLENILTEIDENAATGHGTMNRALLESVGTLLARNQEQSLDDLYDSAYIATSSGEQLERRVADIGLSRNEAVPATGVIEFSRDSEPSASFTAPKGTLVTPTGSNEPTFETTELATIGVLDDFEGGSLDNSYTGDRGSFTVIDGSDAADPNPDQGTYYLEAAATSDVQILNSDETVNDGDTIRYSVYLPTGTAIDCIFHAEDANNHYRATLNESGDTLAATKVDNGSETPLISTSVTVPSGAWLTVEVDTTVNTGTDVRFIDDNDTQQATITFGDDTFDEGDIGFRSADSNDVKYVDHVVTTAAAANIEATEGGEQTNVGPSSIDSIINNITGINFVNNPVPTGETDHINTSGESLVTGVDREDDDELRERAFESTSIGGATTVPAVKTVLLQVDQVISVRIFENDSLNDNTGSGGLPPISIELVIYGGDAEELAQIIFDNIAATERLYSGQHGSSVTKTVTSDVLANDETVEWSRPPKRAIDFTLDITHDETYVGDDEIRRILTEYVGGTMPDGSTTPGIGIGEDVRTDAVRDRLVGDGTGVLGLSNITTTPSLSSSSTGLTIVDVEENEVAETDATDGSITLNTTEI